MWPNVMLAMTLLLAAAQSPTAPMAESQGTLEWGATWRTGHRKPDSLERVVFGARPSIPVEIVAANHGTAAIQVAPPAEALVIEIVTNGGAVSGRLTCSDEITVHRVREGSAVAIESVTSKRITLWPEDSISGQCEVAQIGERLFTPGHYRVMVKAPGWQDASFRQTWWNLEIREPVTAADRKLFHYTEGHELFRREDYTAAAKQFEIARALDPADLTTTLALVGAYERLKRHREAVELLEGALPLAQARKLEPITIRTMTRRLAIAYVADGKEDAAKVLLQRSGFSSEDANRLIASARSRRR